MNNIKEAVFSRGFLLTNEDASLLESTLQKDNQTENLKRWEKTYFGKFKLWVDPLLNYATARDDKIGVGIMGLCVNPFDGLNNNQSIVKRLYESLLVGKKIFYDYVDQLSGAFVVIYRESADVYILQDAAATKAVYYHFNSNGKLAVSSHAAIISRLFRLDFDSRAEEVWKDQYYLKDPSRYLPGLITPYKGLMPLTANNELDVTKTRTRRFFPREPLIMKELNDGLVQEISSIMLRQAALIGSLGRPLLLAATGGKDSRLSAATFSGQPGLRYFSFHMPRTGHLSDDVRIAQQLADVENKNIDIFDLDKYWNFDFNKYFGLHSPMGIWPSAAFCYLNEFESRSIHIRSTVSEIGRCFYGFEKPEVVNPDFLSRYYTKTQFGKSHLVLDAMSEYIEGTDFGNSSIFNYNVLDIFYWEHRNSKWQNVLCAEAEMATDVFIPFNNRELLKLFLSVPQENRRRSDIHRLVTNHLKPDFGRVELTP